VIIKRLKIYLEIRTLGLPHYLGLLKSKGLRELTGLSHFRPLKPHLNSNYIAFVIITLNYHVQFNKNIYYILVYTSTCAFPILLGYSLWLYYLAQHYLLTRGCDHLIGRYRDTTVRAALFAKICIRIKLLTELIKWFISFMSDRTIRFAFNNKINVIIRINDSISQGSPVLLTMFLIFIQYVIRALEHRNKIVIFNYVNDLAMVTESSCARTNSIRL
jgi:hypothetical protein